MKKLLIVIFILGFSKLSYSQVIDSSLIAFADSSFKEYLTGISPANYQFYGFASLADAKNSHLGKGYERYYGLLPEGNDLSIPIDTFLRKQDEIYFVINKTNKKTISSMNVSESDGKMKVDGFNDEEYSQSIQSSISALKKVLVRKDQTLFIVTIIPGGDLFLGYKTLKNELMLYCVKTYPNDNGLNIGSLLPYKDVIKKMQPIHHNHADGITSVL